MPDTDRVTPHLSDLEAQERSIVLSFLSLSERPTSDDTNVMDELALSMALKSAHKKPAN